MTREAQALTDIVARIIDTRRSEISISPSWVATEAMHELDPERISVELVYLGCHLELRQIARGVLRERFDADDDTTLSDDATRQHELFPELQSRYPVPRTRDLEPQYVKLLSLSSTERTFNIDRLAREGRAKLAHSDSLRAFHIRQLAAERERVPEPVA